MCVCATVTSQVRGLPDCHGIKVSPSGRLPSDLNKPTGSLVAGMPADPQALVTTSLSVWCLAMRPGASLHVKPWSPRASTWEPQRHTCGTHRLLHRRKPTATRMASSSNLRPHAAIGRAWSQSPLWGEAAAWNLARSSLLSKPASIIARSCKTSGLSQNDCLDESESARDRTMTTVSACKCQKCVYIIIVVVILCPPAQSLWA